MMVLTSENSFNLCQLGPQKVSLTPFAAGYRKCFLESSFVYHFIVCDFLNITGIRLPDT